MIHFENSPWQKRDGNRSLHMIRLDALGIAKLARIGVWFGRTRRCAQRTSIILAKRLLRSELTIPRRSSGAPRRVQYYGQSSRRFIETVRTLPLRRSKVPPTLSLKI